MNRRRYNIQAVNHKCGVSVMENLKTEDERTLERHFVAE